MPYKAQPSADQSIDRVHPDPLIDQGFEALSRADRSRAELTVALLSFHIALEQICRQMLAQNPRYPPAQRKEVWTTSVNWGDLLADMRKLRLLSAEVQGKLRTLNAERNRLCHRQPMTRWEPEQVEQYGEIARLLRRLVPFDDWVDETVDRDRDVLYDTYAAMQGQASAGTKESDDDVLLRQMLSAPDQIGPAGERPAMPAPASPQSSAQRRSAATPSQLRATTHPADESRATWWVQVLLLIIVFVGIVLLVVLLVGLLLG